MLAASLPMAAALNTAIPLYPKIYAPALILLPYVELASLTSGLEIKLRCKLYLAAIDLA